MSQYPQPPYSQPPLGFDYFQPAGGMDWLAPARRASVMMFVLGGLMLLLAGCMGFTAAVLPTMNLPPEQAEMLQQMEAQFQGISVAAVLAVATAFIGVTALIYIVLGFFVRKGGRVSIVLSLVLSVLVILYLAANLVASIFQPAAGGVAGACMMLVPLVLFVVLIIWLIQALRAGPGAQLAAQQYQSQMWQYQQQQQAYQHPYGAQPPATGHTPAAPPSGGYGYGYRPPPAHPPADEGAGGKGPNGPAT